MGLFDFEDAMILMAGTVLVIMNVGKVLWRHLGGFSCAGLYAAARRHYLRGCKLFTREQPTPPDVRDELFSKRLQGKAIAQARGTYAQGCHILGLTVLIVSVNIVQQASRWMTRWQTVIVLLMFGVCIFVDATPALLPRLVGTYYAICMLGIIMFTWCSSPEYLINTFYCEFILRAFLSVGHFRTYHVLFWNIVAFLAGSTYAWFYAREQFRLVCMYELGATCTLLLAASAIRGATVKGVRRDIQVGILESEVSASMSLLEMLCDVVVELTADMTIAGDSQTMAALLMRNTGSSLVGMNFSDLMPDEAERKKFEDMLTTSAAGEEPPVGSCRAHLADSLSNPVHVEVFSVRVDRHDRRYMLGIRELTDVAEMPSFPPRRHRGRREPAQLGTPPTSAHSSLPSRGQPATAAAPQAPRPGNLRYPDLLPTRQDVRCRGLVMALSQWNIEVPRTVCCAYHAYVMEIKAIVRDRLSQVPCMASFPDAEPAGVQCQACGCLYSAEEEACGMCGSDDARPLPDRLVEV